LGKYDSSLTRVVPVFEELSKRDSFSWLPQLLGLPICGNAISLPEGCDFRVQACDYGEKERKLAPPLALLSWLIRHPERLAQCSAAHDASMPPERRELLAGREGRITEALALLRQHSQGKEWYIFEGETQPDAYIETAGLVVVIEGKRTEREPTTNTTWMPGRHQMLRHIDCAWEIRRRKQVVGFFIVEGAGGLAEVPPRWREFATRTVSSDAIASSLPHRGPEEQREIAACFAGVTTWEKVCRELRIDISSLPESAVPGAASG
jgi:hypothetical protein